MPFSHRETDVRSCGAITIVTGQNFVMVDGKLWAVNGDNNTDGDGALISSKTYVTINGKGVIVRNDNAAPDTLCFTVGGDHCNPIADGYSDLVNVN
jgi:uncharacterized Zn-binding protein involved in type VI secretion